MRWFRRTFPFLFCFFVLLADKKVSPLHGEGSVQNEKLEISATIMPNEQLNRTFDYDFEDHFTVIEVRVTPKDGPIDLKLEDFTLRTDKDGEKSTPFAASQIAGAGALVINRAKENNPRQPGSRNNLPHIPGLGRKKDKKTEAAPPKPEPPAPKVLSEAEAKSLKGKLAARILPEKNSADAVTGLLFFSLEKQKVKDLELLYTTATNEKLRLRFK